MTTAAIAPDPLPEPAPAPVLERGLRRESLIAFAVAVVLAALGLPLALLWRAVTPRVEFVMTEAGPTTVQAEPEGFVAGDGWYVLITFAVGLLAAIAVWALLRRRRGPLMLLGLVAGCVAGGALTAWLGHHIGYAQYRQLLAHAPVGTHFLRPPTVRSGSVGLWWGFLPRLQGAVLVQAVAAAIAYLMLASFHMEPDLRQPDDHGPDLGQPDDHGPDLGQPDDHGPDLGHPLQPAGLTGAAGPAGLAGAAGPADAVSWEPTGSPVPPQSPVPPGSDPAAAPRD